MAGKTKRAVWHEVLCKIHGAQPPDPNMAKAVRVGARGIRKEKTYGCHICKKEKA